MSAEVKLTTRNALRVLRPGPFRRYIIGKRDLRYRTLSHGLHHVSGIGDRAADDVAAKRTRAQNAQCVASR